MSSFIRTLLKPAMYHGFNKQPPFFEGWYYKLVSADERQRYAIIPGVILGDKGHAFIQVLDGVTGQSAYHIFPSDAFWASKDDFDVRIDENRFTLDGIYLNIQNTTGQAIGELKFSGGVPWPVSLTSPGIMGWYAWMPRMECYHGVLSFDHQIAGKIKFDGIAADFSGGRGYIEKDWGKSFPAAWVWFQTNHFDEPRVCLTASVALIPWLGSTFRGFIIGLWAGNKLYRFATYTGARIDQLSIGEHTIDWVVRDRNYRLEMHAQQAPGGLLFGPTTVEMGKRVDETLSASVHLNLSHLSGKLIFEGQGKYSGLEVNGDLPRLRS